MSRASNGTDDQIINLSLNVALRIGLAAFLLIACFVIVSPFMVILAWSAILAVALSGLFEKLVGIVGGRGRAAGLLSVGAIAMVVVPSYFVGGSLVGNIRDLRASLDAGELQVPPPPEFIQGLPVVGERAYEAWQLATDDVQQAVAQFEPQLRSAVSWAIGFLTGIGGAVMQTLVALVIASVFLTYREGATRTIRAVVARISGETEEDYVGIAAATINSVAQGVLGVAAIQAVLCAGLLFAVGFPGAGILSVIMLIIAILQVPGIIIMALPIVWGFSTMGTVGAIAFLVPCIFVGFVDAGLKAVLLGRGVPIPTSIILIGAIGGMVSLGMMGLFLGAVVLGIGYRLFILWLGDDSAAEAEPAAA